VEKLAKQAIKKQLIDFSIRLSKTKGKSLVKKGLYLEWQLNWDQETKGRHLCSARRTNNNRSETENRKLK